MISGIYVLIYTILLFSAVLFLVRRTQVRCQHGAFCMTLCTVIRVSKYPVKALAVYAARCLVALRGSGAPARPPCLASTRFLTGHQEVLIPFQMPSDLRVSVQGRRLFVGKRYLIKRKYRTIIYMIIICKVYCVIVSVSTNSR